MDPDPVFQISLNPDPISVPGSGAGSKSIKVCRKWFKNRKNNDRGPNIFYVRGVWNRAPYYFPGSGAGLEKIRDLSTHNHPLLGIFFT